MDKKSKGIIFFIVAIIVCIAAYLIYTYGFSVENKIENNDIIVQNTTLNEVNEVNNVENVVEQNENEENEQIQNTTEVEQIDEPQESSNSEITSISDEEKAMRIAKDAWGDTEGVYFSNESIGANGDYVIVVTADAKVLARYYINASTGMYTVEYN